MELKSAMEHFNNSKPRAQSSAVQSVMQRALTEVMEEFKGVKPDSDKVIDGIRARIKEKLKEVLPGKIREPKVIVLQNSYDPMSVDVKVEV